MRDLLKWGDRINQSNTGLELVQVALEGYLVLGERAREKQDRDHIRVTLEKVFKCTLDPVKFYSEYFDQKLLKIFEEAGSSLDLPKII